VKRDMKEKNDLRFIYSGNDASAFESPTRLTLTNGTEEEGTPS